MYEKKMGELQVTSNGMMNEKGLAVNPVNTDARTAFVEGIELRNFMALADMKLDFCKGINVMKGDNFSGKNAKL